MPKPSMPRRSRRSCVPRMPRSTLWPCSTTRICRMLHGIVSRRCSASRSAPKTSRGCGKRRAMTRRRRLRESSSEAMPKCQSRSRVSRRASSMSSTPPSSIGEAPDQPLLDQAPYDYELVLVLETAGQLGDTIARGGERKRNRLVCGIGELDLAAVCTDANRAIAAYDEIDRGRPNADHAVDCERARQGHLADLPRYHCGSAHDELVCH